MNLKIRKIGLCDFWLLDNLYDGKSYFSYGFGIGHKKHKFSDNILRRIVKFIYILLTVNMFLLELDKKIIGFVGVRRNRIYEIWVKEKFQRKGYGLKLLEFAENQIDDECIKVITTNAASKFYGKHGYEKTSNFMMFKKKKVIRK